MTGVLGLRSRDWRGLLPREHGSWAYLLGPQIAAILAAPRAGEAAGWAAASLMLFVAFQAFAAAQRRKDRWSLAGILAGVAGLLLAAWLAWDRPAVLLTILPGCVPAALGLVALRGRVGRKRSVEVSAILAMSILGSGGLLLGGGRPGAAALLAIASASYFLLSLIWVRVRLGSEVPGRAPLLPRGWNIPASLVLLLGSATAGFIAGKPVAGFLPGLYLLRGMLPVPRRPDGRLRIPMLGVQEAVTATVFAVGLGLFLPG